MFKSLTFFAIGPEWQPDEDAAAAGLTTATFQPCGSIQEVSSGWSPVRGKQNAPLLEVINGQWLLRFESEKRLLPGHVVMAKVQEHAARIEAETGRKPGRKQIKELKEVCRHELLPGAFTRRTSVLVWIDPKARRLLIGSSTQSKTDEIVSLLVKSIPNFSATSIQTTNSPAVCMTAWLKDGVTPEKFTFDQDCELRSSDERRSVVRYTRHNLDVAAVQEHLQSGLTPSKLAMTFNGRISFVMCEDLTIKKCSFLDVVYESSKAHAVDDEFDADVALATAEIAVLVDGLLEGLGGLACSSQP